MNIYNKQITTKPFEKRYTTDPLNGMIWKPFGAGGRGVSLQLKNCTISNAQTSKRSSESLVHAEFLILL